MGCGLEILRKVGKKRIGEMLRPQMRLGGTFSRTYNEPSCKSALRNYYLAYWKNNSQRFETINERQLLSGGIGNKINSAQRISGKTRWENLRNSGMPLFDPKSRRQRGGPTAF
jgi:hypothetical protein